MSKSTRSKNKQPWAPRLQQKRTRLIDKVWYVIQPFVMYLVIKTAAMLLLSLAAASISVTITNQANAVVNALASLIAAAFLVKDFLKEVTVTGEIDIDSSVIKQLMKWVQNGLKADKVKRKTMPLAVTALLGIASALTFNILSELIQLKSAKYDEVETIQYSVPIWLGLILYGLIAPCVEEMVFRGILYNRMKRYYRLWVCVAGSSALFAVFHGNLIQLLYAFGMGILLAVCYEWVDCFAAPLLFHMAANVFVFVISSATGLGTMLITPVYAGIFAIIMIGLIICIFCRRP